MISSWILNWAMVIFPMHKLQLQLQGFSPFTGGPELLRPAATAEGLLRWCPITEPAQGRELFTGLQAADPVLAGHGSAQAIRQLPFPQQGHGADAQHNRQGRPDPDLEQQLAAWRQGTSQSLPQFYEADPAAQPRCGRPAQRTPPRV